MAAAIDVAMADPFDRREAGEVRPHKVVDRQILDRNGATGAYNACAAQIACHHTGRDFCPTIAIWDEGKALCRESLFVIKLKSEVSLRPSDSQ
jgi:hypothetical protein